MLSLLGFGDLENFSVITGLSSGVPVTVTSGSNMEGDFGSAVLYDKALTDAEVQNLVAVQKQRIASHYEQVASLGSVLLTEGDSITFGIGTEGPTETFRFRLFYGLDFNKHTASSITAEDAEQPFTATDGTPELVINASGHQFQNGNAVQFTTDNTLPGGLTAGVTHYVINRTDNTFEVSLTSGGPAISYVNPGTGTHQVKFVTNKLLLTFPSAHGYDTGDAIQISSTNTLPTGLTEDTIYYVQKRSNTTMFLSAASLVTSPAVVYTDVGIGDATIRAFVPALDDDAEKLNVVSFATSGSVIGDTLSRVPSVVSTIEKVVAEGSRPIVVYMTGVNDLILGLGGAALTTAGINLLGDALQSIWTSYRNAGAKVIACTITAAEVGNPASGFYSEALRTQLNDKIRSLSAYYDALADFGATQQVGTWQDPNDPPGNPNSYFADHVHPKLQGHIVMANILSPLVDNFRL
jgi:lysophospholipase L1-like esterase